MLLADYVNYPTDTNVGGIYGDILKWLREQSAKLLPVVRIYLSPPSIDNIIFLYYNMKGVQYKEHFEVSIFNRK